MAKDENGQVILSRYKRHIVIEVDCEDYEQNFDLVKHDIALALGEWGDNARIIEPNHWRSESAGRVQYVGWSE